MKNTSPAQAYVDYPQYMASKSLTEAISAYGSPETLKAYHDLYTPDFSTPKPSNKLADNLTFLGGMLSNITSTQQKGQKLQAELKNQILDLIKSGDLLPVGFKLPRASSDLPIQIPLDIFISGEINWDKSEIIFKNLEFAGIRVLENQKIKTNKFQRSGNLIIEKEKIENDEFANLNPSQYIDEKMAAKYLGISHRTLQGLRVKGGGPEFAKLGKAVRYKMSDLIKWTDGNKRDNTAQY